MGATSGQSVQVQVAPAVLDEMMYKDKLETFNRKVMEHESTQCGNFVKAHVFAVWPGPHALTPRVKRCGQGHTGFRRCGPGHTKQGRLSSGVARATGF